MLERGGVRGLSRPSRVAFRLRGPLARFFGVGTFLAHRTPALTHGRGAPGDCAERPMDPTEHAFWVVENLIGRRWKIKGGFAPCTGVTAA